MDALLTALVVVVLIVVAAFAGSSLGRRLPSHHLSEASKDIVKFGAGTIATLAALVLGLLVASAKSSYDAKVAETEQSAAKVILLDQLLRQYGPDAKPAREILRNTLIARYNMTWVHSQSVEVAEGKTAGRPAMGADAIRAAIFALVPVNDAQRSLQTRALQAVDDFTQMRWLFIAQSTEGMSIPLLIVLVIWFMTVSFSTALYAPRNGTIAAVAVLSAISVGAAIFLIAEMYTPFSGMLRIPDAPMRAALHYLES